MGLTYSPRTTLEFDRARMKLSTYQCGAEAYNG